jgi:hypothetical protein
MDTRAWLMSGGFERLLELRLAPGEGEGEYLSRFVPDPGVGGFRVLVTGIDRNGVAFQRITAPLLMPTQ